MSEWLRATLLNEHVARKRDNLVWRPAPAGIPLAPDTEEAMSTPERSQDPGEHGYGGTKQEFPTGDDSRAKEHRLEADDDRSSEQGGGEDVRQGGWPPDPEPARHDEPNEHAPNDDELIDKRTDNPDPNETDEDEPIPAG